MDEKHIEIYEKLSRLQWLLGRQRMMNHAAHGPFADPSRGQGRVLAMLKIQPEISTKDLAYLLGIRVPSLNEVLSKLEKGGYIVRKPSETDKRIMINHLTEKGETTDQLDDDYSDVFSCLSEDELKTFGEYLDRVIDALEKRQGDDADDCERENRMRAMRERFGDEQFDHMMRHRGSHRGHGRDCGRGFGGMRPSPHSRHGFSPRDGSENSFPPSRDHDMDNDFPPSREHGMGGGFPPFYNDMQGQDDDFGGMPNSSVPTDSDDDK